MATCAADRMPRPAISVLLFGREKLLSLAASCRQQQADEAKLLNMQLDIQTALGI